MANQNSNTKLQENDFVFRMRASVRFCFILQQLDSAMLNGTGRAIFNCGTL
jgi:hypothetical protein